MEQTKSYIEKVIEKIENTEEEQLVGLDSLRTSSTFEELIKTNLFDVFYTNKKQDLYRFANHLSSKIEEEGRKNYNFISKMKNLEGYIPEDVDFI